MPVYNCAAYVREAIDSILAQTLSSFEFIIIDDGSSDETPAIVSGISDPRIRFHAHTENAGLSVRLNEGLELARGEFIARMDGDDISLPTRFEKQVRFLRENPDIMLCGTAIRTIEPHPKTLRPPLTHGDIATHSLFRIPFHHPTVMWRKSCTQLHGLRYVPSLLRTQDRDFFYRFTKVARAANLREVLLYYRILSWNKGEKSKELVLKELNDIHRRIIEDVLGFTPSDTNLMAHYLLSTSRIMPKGISEWVAILRWCGVLFTHAPSLKLRLEVVRRLILRVLSALYLIIHGQS